MTISIVIATYNRAAHLRSCLEHLARQSFAAGDEIVVADNGSTDATPRVLARFANRLSGRLRVVVETQPGKSKAIARAVEGCTADVLAFTDDDVLVAEDWLSSIRHAMAEDPALALVGGRVLPRFEGRVPAWLDLADGRGFGRLASPLALLDYGPERMEIGPRAILAGNMAVRRSAFVAAGGFPQELGKLRGTLLSGEDHVLCERVQASGGRAVYDPSIRVRHFVPASRLNLRYFVRWFFWSGVTHAKMARAAGLNRGRTVLGVPGYYLKELATALMRVGRAAVCGAWSRAADAMTQAAFAAGFAWAAGLSPASRREEAPSSSRMEAA